MRKKDGTLGMKLASQRPRFPYPAERANYSFLIFSKLTIIVNCPRSCGADKKEKSYIIGLDLNPELRIRYERVLSALPLNVD